VRAIFSPATEAGATFQSAAISPANAQDVVRRWAGAGVTAVASYNDDIAAYVIAGALRSGMKVPNELAVLAGSLQGVVDRPSERVVSVNVSPR